MQAARTIVLNCAGIGSRLGLGRTKVLMEINGRTLLERHLANFRNEPDLRIVVGFQAADVIAATLALRRDAVFVYNHDYFDTGAAYSFWRGSRFGTEEIIQWDGDLIIHPQDATRCLAMPGVFAAYSEKRTSDAVWCHVENGEVRGFSREAGDYEWTGPCCLPRKAITPGFQFIYEIVEKIAPVSGIHVRAMDIDTEEDFYKAQKILASWETG